MERAFDSETGKLGLYCINTPSLTRKSKKETRQYEDIAVCGTMKKSDSKAQRRSVILLFSGRGYDNMNMINKARAVKTNRPTSFNGSLV